ncbi:protein kinase domain-containing protein [Millisia brevis]|uniref:protein kinase domain-containing protein n=1 Tax=Millisia brevis TaxID=264148 RepID=UPI00082B2DCB|nr:protein kinase [Millisia brevis]
MDELAPGTVFAGFTIEQSLGVGGMGTVYLARHPRIPRKVALKLLHRSLTDDDYARTLFEREADHAARLDHPNIVAVLDRGNESGQLWIAMQYVDGINAAAAVRDEPMDPQRAVEVIRDIASALDYAHEQGVLHRDVKPANILLEQTRSARPGRVLLADFGIAKALTETNQHTKTGMLVASLQYAAPEQFEAAQLDRRADVYSLGCTLFHLLTGRPPYPGSALPKLMNAHLHGSIPAPSYFGVGVPVPFDRVIEHALAKKRTDRFDSASELARAAAAALVPATAPAPAPPISAPFPVMPTTPALPNSPAVPNTPPMPNTSVPSTQVASTAAVQPIPPNRFADHGVDPTTVVTVNGLPAAASSPVPTGGRGRRLGAVAAAALVVLAVIAGAVWFMNRSGGTEEPPAVASTSLQGADGATYTVAGDILDKYDSLTDAQRADLGLPMSDEKANPDGIFQWFVGGVIIRQTGREAHVVWGEIRNRWNELGGSQGELGYPTSDELDIGGAKVSTFERGTVTFANGETTVDTWGR